MSMSDNNIQNKSNKTFYGCLWIVSILIAVFVIAPPVHEFLSPSQQLQTNRYQSEQTYQQVIPTTQTVYITRTGERYHRGDCHHLRQSRISIDRSAAIKNGYTPCKNCNP